MLWTFLRHSSVAWVIAVLPAAHALAQDQVATPVPDTTLTSDTVVVDTTALFGPFTPEEDTSWARFAPPSRWLPASSRETEKLLAGPAWPMPPVDQIAGSDIADWLAYHPAYDVDDAPGVGQTRFFTRWGLVDRIGHWQVDGRSLSWQRLTFPMTPQFDPAILPSFTLESPHVGDAVILNRDTVWSERPVLDYTFRQGDYSDTYSEGYFRGHTKRGFGFDLSGVFFSSDGRFGVDSRDKRILALETFGPLKKQLYWRAHYDQFRDKSIVLTPSPFEMLHPRRNDLLWSAEGAVGHMSDSGASWQFGGRFQSGVQRLTDPEYRIASEDRDWQLFGMTQISSFDVRVFTGLEELGIDSVHAERWYARGEVARMWRLGEAWNSAVRVSLSDWDTDPPSLSATAVLKPQMGSLLRPSLRVSRERTVPTLFDRERPEIADTLIDANLRLFIYSEAGDPHLDDQWENSIGVQWGSETMPDTIDFGWTVGGHAAYVENYTLWNVRESPDSVSGVSVSRYSYGPRQADARSLGAAVGIQGRLLWKIHYFANYAVKYVTSLDNVKLSGYYPHKGSAMVSLIAPKWRYGVDLRLNAAALWWYGDRRIEPTIYVAPHVLRVDLSGSARVVGDLSVYALLQNIGNFQYRTAAGYPMTGRTVRFGLHVTLFD